MAWWLVESDLKLDGPASNIADLEKVAGRCFTGLLAAGAAEPVLTGDPTQGTVHATFMVNTVTTVEDARNSGVNMITSVAENERATSGALLTAITVEAKPFSI